MSPMASPTPWRQTGRQAEDLVGGTCLPGLPTCPHLPHPWAEPSFLLPTTMPHHLPAGGLPRPHRTPACRLPHHRLPSRHPAHPTGPHPPFWDCYHGMGPRHGAGAIRCPPTHWWLILGGVPPPTGAGGEVPCALPWGTCPASGVQLVRLPPPPSVPPWGDSHQWAEVTARWVPPDLGGQ